MHEANVRLRVEYHIDNWDLGMNLSHLAILVTQNVWSGNIKNK